jgi:hypothetical protein
MPGTTQVIGFCILCRRKSVMNELISVTLPRSGAAGKKGKCSYCQAMMFKLV